MPYLFINDIQITMETRMTMDRAITSITMTVDTDVVNDSFMLELTRCCQAAAETERTTASFVNSGQYNNAMKIQ